MEKFHRLALPNGTRLGQFEIIGILGHGGFGITYLAFDSKESRKVAIKELFPTDITTRDDDRKTVVPKSDSDTSIFKWALDRFKKEGDVISECRHPSIVKIFTSFFANNTAYLVTEFIDGLPLGKWADSLGRRPSERELVAIMNGILEGLFKIHTRGFLHRDIKPDNILIRKNGQPVLIDFGSARQAIGGKTRDLTTVITPGFAPFEQYSSMGEQGPWTDFYSLGATFYNLISGTTPPESPGRVSKDTYRLLSEYPKISRSYSDDFLSLIDWALAVDHSHRPQTIEQWQQCFKPPTKRISNTKNISKPKFEPPPLPISRQEEKIPGGWFATVIALNAVVGSALGLYFQHWSMWIAVFWMNYGVLACLSGVFYNRAFRALNFKGEGYNAPQSALFYTLIPIYDFYGRYVLIGRLAKQAEKNRITIPQGLGFFGEIVHSIFVALSVLTIILIGMDESDLELLTVATAIALIVKGGAIALYFKKTAAAINEGSGRGQAEANIPALEWKRGVIGWGLASLVCLGISLAQYLFKYETKSGVGDFAVFETLKVSVLSSLIFLFANRKLLKNALITAGVTAFVTYWFSQQITSSLSLFFWGAVVALLVAAIWKFLFSFNFWYVAISGVTMALIFQAWVLEEGVFIKGFSEFKYFLLNWDVINLLLATVLMWLPALWISSEKNSSIRKFL